MHIALKATLLQLGCSLLAVGLGWTYFELAIAPKLDPVVRDALARWAFQMMLASTAVLLPVHLWLFSPICSAIAKAKDGSLSEALLVSAHRRAVALPILFSRTSSYAWSGAVAVVPLYLSEQALADAWGPGLLNSLCITLVIAAVASTIVFYAIEWHVRRRVLPQLPGTVKLETLKGLTPVPIGFKIFMLVFSTVVLPLGAIAVSATIGGVSTAAILYLCVWFGVLGAVQGAFIAQSVFLPLRALAGQMKRVQQSDLQASAEVQSLDEVAELSHGFNEMVFGLKRAQYVEDTFGRYVTPAVRDAILGGQIELGGEVRICTVMFADIRGFTALSERLSAPEVVKLLNAYLDRMVDVIVRNGGTIDKFIGDAIMATFGVPVPRSVEADAQAAVRAAIEMSEALDAWNAERAHTGEPPLGIGIGLHTGPVVAGNIGSSKKTEYTVIGDTVNTASRIESLTKTLSERILISAATFEQVKSTAACTSLGAVEVRGKSRPLDVYAVRAAPALLKTA